VCNTHLLSPNCFQLCPKTKSSGRKTPRGPERKSPWFPIDKNGSGNILVGAVVAVVVHRYTLKLKVVVAFVETVTFYTMLVRYHLPEFGTYREDHNKRVREDK
jgi:hypothetical protein